MSSWYVGERVSIKCCICGERLQTKVDRPNGALSRTTHIACEKQRKCDEVHENTQGLIDKRYLDD